MRITANGVKKTNHTVIKPLTLRSGLCHALKKSLITDFTRVITWFTALQ